MQFVPHVICLMFMDEHVLLPSGKLMIRMKNDAAVQRIHFIQYISIRRPSQQCMFAIRITSS